MQDPHFWLNFLLSDFSQDVERTNPDHYPNAYLQETLIVKNSHDAPMFQKKMCYLRPTCTMWPSQFDDMGPSHSLTSQRMVMPWPLSYEADTLGQYRWMAVAFLVTVTCNGYIDLNVLQYEQTYHDGNFEFSVFNFHVRSHPNIKIRLKSKLRVHICTEYINYDLILTASDAGNPTDSTVSNKYFSDTTNFLCEWSLH